MGGWESAGLWSSWSKKKKWKIALSLSSPEQDFLFFYIYDVITSPGKEKSSSTYYSETGENDKESKYFMGAKVERDSKYIWTLNPHAPHANMCTHVFVYQYKPWALIPKPSTLSIYAIHTYTHIRAYACMYTYIHTPKPHIFNPTNLNMHTWNHTYFRTCIPAYTRIHKHTCMTSTYKSAYIYIHTYTCTCTCIHTERMHHPLNPRP